jgi:hypothetical protein
MNDNFFSEPLLRNVEHFISNFLYLDDGSVVNCINSKNRSYDFVYNEITGYQLSIMLMQREFYNTKKYDEKIRKTVDYLKSQVENGNRFVHGTKSNGSRDNRCFVFDNCIILQALVSYYIAFRDDAILDLCYSIGQWVVSMQELDGSFRSLAHDDHCLGSVDTFAGDFSCINVKSIIALLRLYKLCGESSFLDSVRRSINWADYLQDENSGLFYATAKKSHFFLHAHCYTVEGLLYYCFHYEDNDVKDMVFKSINGLAALQNRFGAIPHTWKENRSLKKKIRYAYDFGLAVDATVQARKILSTYSILYNTDEFNHCLEGFDRFILSQYDYYSKSDFIGSIGYRKHRLRLRNTQHVHLNAWPNQFLLGAAYLRKKFDEDNKIGKRFLDLHWI